MGYAPGTESPTDPAFGMPSPAATAAEMVSVFGSTHSPAAFCSCTLNNGTRWAAGLMSLRTNDSSTRLTDPEVMVPPNESSDDAGSSPSRTCDTTLSMPRRDGVMELGQDSLTCGFAVAPGSSLRETAQICGEVVAT